MLLEQSIQYLAPSKGCADLILLWLLLGQSSAVFVTHLTNLCNMLFLCDSNHHKNDICSILVSDRLADTFCRFCGELIYTEGFFCFKILQSFIK